MSDDIESLRRDAMRYRYLRSMHWSDRGLTVTNARSVRLGHDTFSRERLDEVVDEALAAAPPPSQPRSTP